MTVMGTSNYKNPVLIALQLNNLVSYDYKFDVSVAIIFSSLTCT